MCRSTFLNCIRFRLLFRLQSSYKSSVLHACTFDYYFASETIKSKKNERDPTDFFTILELHDGIARYKIRHSTDFKALELFKRVGRINREPKISIT